LKAAVVAVVGIARSSAGDGPWSVYHPDLTDRAAVIDALEHERPNAVAHLAAVAIQRRAFAKGHAYSSALDQEAAQDALTGLRNRRRLLSVIDALAAVAILMGCLAVYALFMQRRTFAKAHAYSAALDQEVEQDALTGLPNQNRSNVVKLRRQIECQ
jgi:GGDEF domain-containing protein